MKLSCCHTYTHAHHHHLDSARAAALWECHRRMRATFITRSHLMEKQYERCTRLLLLFCADDCYLKFYQHTKHINPCGKHARAQQVSLSRSLSFSEHSLSRERKSLQRERTERAYSLHRRVNWAKKFNCVCNSAVCAERVRVIIMSLSG
jgi:hypothetical protein